ncbi:helix-turn-helix domain-containing protein [Candidatus Poriferisodalis sp.]|uniref:helix-turn-helix domain-containing protein n=1 Tax=Candidatus Poriferisodalis sp. TaxID=3101277 RepID=UPI003B59216A
MTTSSEDPDSSEPEALGRRLREAREAIGLPQAAVGDYLGIPRASVSDIETGRRRVAFLELKQLATLYRRPFSYFSGDDEGDVVNATAQALYRTASELSEDDRQQVLRFAQFLREAGPARPPDRVSPGEG